MPLGVGERHSVVLRVMSLFFGEGVNVEVLFEAAADVFPGFHESRVFTS